MHTPQQQRTKLVARPRTLVELPLELVIHIFAYLPEPRNRFSGVSRAFAAAVTCSPVSCDLLLTLCNSVADAVHLGDPLRFAVHGLPPGRFGTSPKGLTQAHTSLWAMWPLHSFDAEVLHSGENLLREARLVLGRQLGRRVILRLARVEIATLSGHVVLSGRPEERDLLTDECRVLLSDLRPSHVTVHKPPAEVLHLMPAPTAIELLDLTDIHTQLDLSSLATPAFENLKHLHLTSDGRLERGSVRAVSLNCLTNLHASLETLELDGPWMQDMFDFPHVVFDMLEKLTALKTLLADFEPRRHSPEAVARLVRMMPNLRSLGRLGFVDRAFWRLLRSHDGAHLTVLTVGSKKEPFSSRPTNCPPGFIPDLALGILIACPNVTDLTIWMGFRGEIDGLLGVVRRIREGGITSDPERKSKLAMLRVFQAVDAGNLDTKAWQLAVGRDLRVEIRSGAGLANELEEVVRFGQFE
ncbi:hypothetical protein HDU87_002853 [Geranomyces variabilis]|uniref:F-box domain-containing protein n=1 Tax=Geranomyces variabilis TaxID=109894 RepID=A0AAD5TNA4_9FUNG|nr:hypothetical protein HDU87_002853 [Geranomyces variabilis]